MSVGALSMKDMISQFGSRTSVGALSIIDMISQFG